MRSQNRFSQVPKRSTSANGLGPMLGIFKVTAINTWISATLGILLIGASGSVAVYAGYDTLVQLIRYGPVTLVETILVPLVLSFLLFIPGALTVINAHLSWKKSVVVYERGLTYSDNSGIQVWYWQDIEWFYAAVTKNFTSRTHQYILQKTNGNKLRLDNKFESITLLGPLIGRKIAPHQYRKLLYKIRAGQTVRLGQVSIGRHNLAINKKIYSWDEVDALELKNGYAGIKKRGGGWFSGAKAPVSNIPNLDALFTVVAQIVRIKIAH
jgi:hypothetical protein